MKRLILIFIMFSSLSLMAQTKFGIRGGVNLVNVNEDLGGTEVVDFNGEPIEITLNQSNRTTFNVGGLIEFWLTPMFALQINALYNQKGLQLKGDFSASVIEQGVPIEISGSEEDQVKLTYLSFPVLAKVAIGKSNVKPYVMAGPEIGFLLSAKNAVKATAEGEAMGEKFGPITANQEEDIKESFESFEFAINFGAGLTIPLGRVDLFADGQYSLGLTKINKESDGGESVKNQVIMIDIGVLFGSN